ncbi:MAG: GNAT family N-acetyltransferase [Desulfobacterales bacterium]
MLTIKPVDPAQIEVMDLIEQLDEYQSSLYPPESNHLDSIEELSKSNALFLAAYLDAEICGIGSVKIMGEYGELKRVYVTSNQRGKGIAKAIVKDLESRLIKQAVTYARLETGIHQKEAVKLYEKLGYYRIDSFGGYKADPLSVFMEKKLLRS